MNNALKMTVHSISRRLCVLFNIFIIKGEFQKQFKEPSVIPIHKNEVKNKFSNYIGL